MLRYSTSAAQCCCRVYSSVSNTLCEASSRYAQALTVTQKGEPLDVLELRDVSVQDPGDGQILLKILGAPINPSDINTVQGKYPLQPKYDNIPGHEGVAQVVATGPKAFKFKEGDIVVPLTSGLGTWRTEGVYDETDWHSIPPDIGLENAATLTVNPGTALSMLENFVKLAPGDVVIQNGANSAVGRHVIQLCKHMEVKTVNVVRSRPNFSALESDLKGIGADVVSTPDEVREQCKVQGLPAPKLALNCVGGDIATTMAKMLAPGGTLVTYGGMSLKPVTIPTPVLIFKDIKVRGFWISGGEASSDTSRKALLLDRVAVLIKEGAVKADCIQKPLSEWRDVMESIAEGSGKKYILVP